MLEDVKKLYSYTKEEQQDFNYISEYMSRIVTKSDIFLKDALHRSKYVIAGLFLTHKSCIQIGIPMSSYRANELPSPHKERLSNFKIYTGHEITSTKQYLRILNYNPLLSTLLFTNIGIMLHKYVVSPKPIKWN